jgi:hypothetical protein
MKTLAEKIVDDITKEIFGRSGLDDMWATLEPDIRDEIVVSCVALVKRRIQDEGFKLTIGGVVIANE